MVHRNSFCNHVTCLLGSDWCSLLSGFPVGPFDWCLFRGGSQRAGAVLCDAGAARPVSLSTQCSLPSCFLQGDSTRKGTGISNVIKSS